jgi:hypothetical protein
VPEYLYQSAAPVVFHLFAFSIPIISIKQHARQAVFVSTLLRLSASKFGNQIFNTPNFLANSFQEYLFDLIFSY